MDKFVKLLLVFFACQHFIYAQTDSLSIHRDTLVFSEIKNDTLVKETIWQKLTYDARNGANGFLYTFAQPTRWDKKDLAYFGGTLVGTGILYLSDEEISSFFRRQNNDIPPSVSEFGFRFGKPLVNYGLTGSIYMVGLLSDNEQIRYTGVLLITSASVGGLLQQVMKTVAGRARPSTELGYNHFRPFNGSPSFSSFPSGHTVLSVTTCYALSKQFTNPWVKGGFYALGMVSPLSRIWEGAHWASDVFLSTVMSVAIVECVDSYLKRDSKYKLNPEERKNKISWNVKMGYNQLGLVGTF